MQLAKVEGEVVLTSVIRLETEGDKVSRLRCYTFCPDAMREVAGAFGEKLGPAVYSFESFRAAWAAVKPPS